MNYDTLARLIDELVRLEQMLVVIDSGGAVAEMHASSMKPTEFDGKWAMIEAQDWHIHLNLETVKGVQFVENSDHGHEAMPKVYYVRLSDARGGTLLRFYFPNPWLDDDEKPAEFQPERVRFFEDFCGRYAGREGIVFVERTPQGDIYHEAGEQ